MTLVMKWYGPQVEARAKAGAARGLHLWAEHVLEESTRVVPVAPSEGGTLRDSGHAWDTDSVGWVGGERGQQAAVSYDTVYAVKQHEELGYRHSAGKTAKYLEVPLNASQKAGPALVAREVKKAL